MPTLRATELLFSLMVAIPLILVIYNRLGVRGVLAAVLSGFALSPEMKRSLAGLFERVRYSGAFTGLRSLTSTWLLIAVIAHLFPLADTFFQQHDRLRTWSPLLIGLVGWTSKSMPLRAVYLTLIPGLWVSELWEACDLRGVTVGRPVTVVQRCEENVILTIAPLNILFRQGALYRIPLQSDGRKVELNTSGSPFYSMYGYVLFKAEGPTHVWRSSEAANGLILAKLPVNSQGQLELRLKCEPRGVYHTP